MKKYIILFVMFLFCSVAIAENISPLEQCKEDCRICGWNCHIDWTCVSSCLKVSKESK